MNNRQLRILLARSCMSAFVRHTMPGYLMGWVHERICEELDQFLQDVVEGRSPRLMLTMPPRHGKLCADDTEVPTPGGWRRHGDLLPGDLVLGVDGRPVRVLAVGEPDMASHLVRFTNGASVAVHLAHEWTLYDHHAGRQGEALEPAGRPRHGRPRSRARRGASAGAPEGEVHTGGIPRRPLSGDPPAHPHAQQRAGQPALSGLRAGALP